MLSILVLDMSSVLPFQFKMYNTDGIVLQDANIADYNSC